MSNYPNPPGLNPRDKRPGDRKTFGTTGRPGGAVWYVLGFLMLMALAQVWYFNPGGKTISYSDFKQAVRASQVAEVFVGEQTIHGKYKRPRRLDKFNANRIEIPSSWKNSRSGVSTPGVHKPLVPEVLSWAILLLFLSPSGVLLRRMGRRGRRDVVCRSKHRVFRRRREGELCGRGRR